MKPVLPLLAALLLAAPAAAQPPGAIRLETVQPSTRERLKLGPSGAGEEQWERIFDQNQVRNVVSPALYPMLPRPGKANGKAVIVVPGGGYRFVSIESEGFLVAEALAARGYAAFVLKYRTLPTPREPGSYMAEIGRLFGSLGKGKLEEDPAAVDDLAAAIALVRRDAARWNLDPAQIGAIGFSAGSRTLIRLIEQKPEARLLENAALLYPPMTEAVRGGPRPPAFIAIAADDPLFVQGGLGLVQAWAGESAKTEFHLYSGGSHGFGMHLKGTTSDLWIEQYLAWLERH